MEWTNTEYILIALIFVWTGFVRTGLGFGGAALGLPLMLLLGASPVYWLPIIGIHLLFFTSLTLRKSLHNVDWLYLKKSLVWILPTTLLGVFGLVSLPDKVMVVFVYSVTLFYAFIWVLDKQITSHSSMVDKFLLLLGGYVAGTSLTGAPLLVSVFMRHITKEKLRNTLFVLWFILVSIKMSTFVILGVTIFWQFSLMLIPTAMVGHLIGLKLHTKIIANDTQFKKITGFMLIFISSFGLLKIFL
jgi:uncharacterized membrane protein YfcA